MILGIGTDLVQIERIEKAITNKRFCERIYTEAERSLIAKRPMCAAGNFAVKESVVKAFGTGFSVTMTGKAVRPTDIEVLREENGKPYVCLYGTAKEVFEKMGGRRLHVSITNERELAMAYVILEGAADNEESFG